MLPPPMHLEVAGPRGSMRALLAHGAVCTIALGEIHNDDLIAIRILTGRPQAAALPQGTRHRLRLPIDREAGDIEALLRLGLPGGIQGNRADECHGMVLMRRGQIGGVHIPGIQQMLGGQQVLRGQMGVDPTRHGAIRCRGGHRFDIHDQVQVFSCTQKLCTSIPVRRQRAHARSGCVLPSELSYPGSGCGPPSEERQMSPYGASDAKRPNPRVDRRMIA